MVLLVIFLYTRIRGNSLIDRSQLTEEDHTVEQTMSLKRAAIPWVALVILSLVTTLVEPIKQFLASDLDLVLTFGQVLVGGDVHPYAVSTKFLWQAYTLMLIATLVSIPFLSRDRKTLGNTMRVFLKRAPRPVLAAAIFFAMAEVMNFSGFTFVAGVMTPPTDPSSNMIYLLASVTAGLGILYPLVAPFLGLLAGFISGSETSAIAMFTNYHYQASTSVLIGANPLVVSASNGIGGGLASVLSPAKIQNAAAVIDEIGIEGQVIRYGAVVAILMTLATAIMTFIWAFS
jgi:lactate permease